MISIEEARKLIAGNCAVLEEVEMQVAKSNDYVLVTDLLAPIDLPSFRQSAMDGFAMKRSDLEQGLRKFDIQAEVQAGLSEKFDLEDGKAARIFTGAVVPDNADMVIIQEKTHYDAKQVEVVEYSGDQKSNIRRIGEQITKGELALKKGHLINPATIGFMASLGLETVRVYRRPVVSIVSTGNELRSPGQELQRGEIYESNAVSLTAALETDGYLLAEELKVADDFDQTFKTLSEAMKKCDVLLISGGISVGEYDFVKEVLEKLGVKDIFHKINQKPGKPMYFGKKDHRLIFALPGNPASLLTCYYEYVSPALKMISGKRVEIVSVHKKLTHDYHFKGQRPEFLKARVSDETVTLLEGQGSFILKSFAMANALVYIYGSERLIEKNSTVEVHLIPTI